MHLRRVLGVTRSEAKRNGFPRVTRWSEERFEHTHARIARRT